MTTIKGIGIFIRPYEMRDKQVVFDGVHEPVGLRLTGTHGSFTMEQIEAYIRNNAEDDSRAGWVICREDEQVVGEVVINDIDSDNRSANIRIALYAQEHFNKGYGSKAMRLALHYGFTKLNLHRIELGVYAFNPRAIHVYEKLGFKQEDILRDSLFWEGEYIDQIVMSILENEWTWQPEKSEYDEII